GACGGRWRLLSRSSGERREFDAPRSAYNVLHRPPSYRQGTSAVRQLLIRFVLPVLFCLVPFLIAALVAVCVPQDARDFFLDHIGKMDTLILGLGTLLF